MDYTAYLLVANVAVWLGVGGYMMFIGARQRRFELRLAQMEQLRDDV
ncbi:CcmD family protein [Desulfobaculum xiamenense]|uniref:CcmD family protein n=1 Tax=Desulfobaculum xiamenense TaxID=995050 RepID=A0A846QJV7_9BACT|nr:CcmD family protein [Desulfobaculum xiamenense]NJB67397.1 CcmD family protein [Desulfobaculum xiamenense]